MPAANLQSVIKNIVSGSPAQTGATPTTATAAATGAAPADPGTGGSPFDAILMLEELAASAQPMDGAETGIDAGAAELDLDAKDIEVSDDADDGEDSVEDPEDPLAFLVGLLSIAPPPASVQQGASGDSDDGSQGEPVVSGGKGHAAVVPLPGAPEASGAPTLPDSLTADASAGAATNGSSTGETDAAAAARLLAAQAALTGGDSTKSEDKAISSRATDLLTHAPRGAAQVDAPQTVHVASHVRDPRWADEFATRISMLVNQRESVASLSLTPVDLGPVDVSITVKDSQATIHFGAAQADTRQLIESSLPKLKELLAAQGFNLTDASVSQGFNRQARKGEAPSIPRPSSVEEVTQVTGRKIQMNGLLDTYA